MRTLALIALTSVGCTLGAKDLVPDTAGAADTAVHAETDATGPDGEGPDDAPAPRAADDAYTLAEGATLATTPTLPACGGIAPQAADGVLTNDCGVGLTASLVTAPTHARSFALAADGSFTYVAGWGWTGVDSFVYAITDGATTASAVVAVTVTEGSVDCPAVLAEVDCQWLPGPAVWNCGSQDLSGRVLARCDLADVSLFNADLSGADLTGADLTDANFFGADVTDVIWRGTICRDGVDSDAAGGTCCGHLNNPGAGC